MQKYLLFLKALKHITSKCSTFSSPVLIKEMTVTEKIKVQMGFC